MAHGHFPVSVAGYFGEQREYGRSFFLIGGPVGLAVTGAASMARNASKKREAERAALPRWHALGTADVVVTNQRLVATANGQVGSFPYAELGPLQLAPGARRRPGGAAPAGRAAPRSGSNRRRCRCSTCSSTTSWTAGRPACRCLPACSSARSARGGSASSYVPRRGGLTSASTHQSVWSGWQTYLSTRSVTPCSIGVSSRWSGIQAAT